MVGATLAHPALPQVVNTPEILAVIDNIPMLANFLNALYDCDYKLFFQAFPVVTDEMRKDRYMVQHVRFFEREMRIVAYTQFLESYAPPPPAHTATAAAATRKCTSSPQMSIAWGVCV